MATITSAFKGITTPLADLYTEIHTRGWQVTKVDTQDGSYIATAKNPHGQTVEKVGRDVPTALAAILSYIVRREFVRQGAWTNHWADQLEPIAQAYAKAPAFDPNAAGAWWELAQDSQARAQQLAQQLDIEVVDEPEPYSSPQEMWKDIEKNKHLLVSRANSDHPLWNEDQVVAYRVCHDVLGHAAAGGDFGWTGENLATAAHMPYLSPSAQAALFSEAVGNAAYNSYYKGWGPKKITFLNEYLEPAQEANNPAGHGGEPMGATLAPGALPTRTASHVLNWEPGREGKGFITSDGTLQTWKTNRGRPFHDDMNVNAYPGATRLTIYEDGRTEILGGQPWHAQAISQADPRLKPREYGAGWDWTEAKVAGLKRDPNFRYETGIVPPSVNAVTHWNDPLDHNGLKEVAHNLNTGWANWTDADGEPDYERMKVAIMNAFRAALLSPLKSLKWNAVQYQDISHIPYHVADPKIYWGALEGARVNHNRSVGVMHPELQHKAHCEALLDFYRYYQKHHPEMGPSEAKHHADSEVLIMQAEIEEKLMADAKEPDMEIFEPKVFKELDKRLKIIVKDDKMLYSAALPEDANPYGGELYGGFIGRHLISIAKVARYADLLLESALEDVRNHDGAGHIFRQTTLSLKIPYVGPKIASFIWLLLQPMTSQLATIDTHMADVLGYDNLKVNNNRDYFRLERELQAGRDAAGYSHLPLGQFQWGMWDMKRTGEGTHQDHSALRAWEPTKHHTIDWQPVVASPAVKGANWQPPEWWAITQPYRDNEVAKWNIDVAPYHPKGQVPWMDQNVNVHIANMPPACPACGALTLRNVGEAVECESCHAQIPVGGKDYSIQPGKVRDWSQNASEDIPADLLWQINDEMPTRHGSAMPTIHEVDTQRADGPDEYYFTRRPFLYEKQGNNMYLGERGTHHSYIQDTINSGGFEVGGAEFYRGYVWTEPKFGGAFQGKPSENVGWWNRPAFDSKRIEEHLLNAFPQYRWESQAQPEEDWDDE